MITFSAKCQQVVKIIKDLRSRLESLYPSVGNSDRLFQFQAELCSIGQSMEQLEKRISYYAGRGTYTRIPYQPTERMREVAQFLKHNEDYFDDDLLDGLTREQADIVFDMARGNDSKLVEVPDEEPLPANVTQKEYLLFAWSSYCEGGGALDYRAVYPSLDAALAYVNNENNTLSKWNIFDVSLKRIVACHNCDEYGRNARHISGSHPAKVHLGDR